MKKTGTVKYIVYDNDGNILRIGVCPADMMEQQKDIDQKVMEQEDQSIIVNDIDHEIKEGKIVEKTEIKSIRK